MDILAKMQEKSEQFEKLKSGIGERQDRIQVINNEIQQINVEMNRIQGEYRLLTEMGIEAGLLDENGQPKAEAAVTDKKPELRVLKPEDSNT